MQPQESGRNVMLVQRNDLNFQRFMSRAFGRLTVWKTVLYFVLLSFFVWQLCYLFFFDLHILITLWYHSILRAYIALKKLSFLLQEHQYRTHNVVFLFRSSISAKHAALRRMSNDWLARNLDNVSDWSHTDFNFSELPY
jgi:hypothetical protein